jgi:hypothetical protein
LKDDRNGRCAIAKEKPIYEIVEEFGDMLTTLVNVNEDKFGEVDPKMLRMVKITNKEPPEVAPYFKIKAINNPTALFCPFRFIVITWSQAWDVFDEDQRALLLLDVLHYLAPDEEEPKLIQPDIKDHGPMLRTFGVDYMSNPDLKGILKGPIRWRD